MERDYRFVNEIYNFRLDAYVAHLGWIGSEVTTIKIYSLVGSNNYYLHDETTNRLFEFAAADPQKLRSSQEYWKVVKAYLASQPGNSN